MAAGEKSQLVLPRSGESPVG